MVIDLTAPEGRGRRIFVLRGDARASQLCVGEIRKSDILKRVYDRSAGHQLLRDCGTFRSNGPPIAAIEAAKGEVPACVSMIGLEPQYRVVIASRLLVATKRKQGIAPGALQRNTVRIGDECIVKDGKRILNPI